MKVKFAEASTDIIFLSPKVAFILGKLQPMGQAQSYLSGFLRHPVLFSCAFTLVSPSADIRLHDLSPWSSIWRVLRLVVLHAILTQASAGAVDVKGILLDNGCERTVALLPLSLKYVVILCEMLLSIQFPVSTIIISIALAQPQLYRVQTHDTRQVDPSGDVATAFTTLTRPPFARMVARS